MMEKEAWRMPALALAASMLWLTGTSAVAAEKAAGGAAATAGSRPPAAAEATTPGAGGAVRKAKSEHHKTTAREAAAAARRAIERKVRRKGAAKADIERRKIFDEAVAALRETRNAIAALEKKDGKKALAALEKAIGKLELVLARDPRLALAPVDVTSRTLDIYADVKSVRKAVAEAVRLLKTGRVQEARALVSGLASEIVIEVLNIPLVTYPDAIKAVVPLIERGKYREAREALVAALNTLVVTRHVIPLPILRVEQMLERAERLAEKANRSAAEEKELAGILKAARGELRFAEALGYGRKSDFRHFYEQLDEIARRTKAGGHGRGFFDELKKALADFRARLF